MTRDRQCYFTTMTYTYLYKFKLAIIARENSRVSVSVSVDTIVYTHTHTHTTYTYIFRTYMTDLVLTRHTYIPVLSSFAETMLVPTRAKDTRQDDPSGTTGKENERRERNTRTRRGYAFARAVRFGLRYVHACVRACDTKTMRSRRYLDASRRTTTRPAVRDPGGKLRDTHTYLHVYTHIYRGTHAPFEAHASPETRMVAFLFAKIRAKKKRRVGAGRSRKKTTRATSRQQSRPTEVAWPFGIFRRRSCTLVARSHEMLLSR